MASPEQKRKFNTVAGSVFIAGALLFIGFATYYVVVPAEPMPTPVLNATRVDPQACTDVLRQMDFHVTYKNGDSHILATTELPVTSTAEAARYHLDKMSMATLVCKYPLSEFCMGTQCVPSSGGASGALGPGVFIKLKVPSDNKKTEAKAQDSTTSPAPNKSASTPGKTDAGPAKPASK